MAAVVLARLFEASERPDVSAQVAQQACVSAQTIESVIDDLLAAGLLIEDGKSPPPDPGDPKSFLRSHGWTHAADYLGATYAYPFEPGEEGNGTEAARRMRAFVQEAPDTERCLQRAGEVVELLNPLSTAEPAKGTPRDLLLNLIAITFCATGTVRVPWTDEPLLLRTSPSGGARHPTEGYLVVVNWPGLQAGIYHVQAHPALLRRLDLQPDIAPCDLLPELQGRAPFQVSAAVGLTSVFARNMYRYRDPRTFRSVHLDAGHVVGTIEAVAGELGITTKVHYAADEQAWTQFLGLDPLLEGFQASVALELPK